MHMNRAKPPPASFYCSRLLSTHSCKVTTQQTRNVVFSFSSRLTDWCCKCTKG